MSTGARLHARFGYQVGVGQVWGRAQYGIIGYGIGVVEGIPLFHTGDLSEFTEEVASVPGRTYGTQMYGTIGTRLRQGQVAGPVTRFFVIPNKAYSPEFIEDEAMDIELRILEDETRAYEFSEVEWPS